MPLWLERFFIEHPWAAWWPLVVCVVGAGALWWWQSQKGRDGGKAKKPVRVGWPGAVMIVGALLAGIAYAGHTIGLWSDLWKFVNERPTLVAWWMAAVGATVIAWGVAVHMWRGEARLARQCRRCGYDMTGVAGLMTCPECGRMAKNEKQLRPRNVRRAALWVGGLIILVACLLTTGFAVLQRGAPGALPTRTLLWWVGRSSEPPDSVMRETLWRMTQAEGAGEWGSVAAPHADDLAARMFDCPLGNIDDYAALLQTVEVSDERQRQAVNAMSSPDAVRRLAALKLLSAARSPIEIDEKVIAQWERDTGPGVGAAAYVVRYSQISHAMSQIYGATAVPLTDEAALRNFRICTSTQAIWMWELPGLKAYAKHPNHEIALRATCILGASEFNQIDPDPENLVAMFKAKDELDRSSFGPGPVWASAGQVCMAGRFLMAGGAPGPACMARLVHHKDAGVREMLFRQLSPSATIPRGASWALVIAQWQPVLPELERQLQVEDDAKAKDVLVRLIEEIKGAPPVGQTP